MRPHTLRTRRLCFGSELPMAYPGNLARAAPSSGRLAERAAVSSCVSRPKSSIWMIAIVFGIARCGPASETPPAMTPTAVVLSAQAVSPNEIYLSWTFDPGSCSMSSAIYQDGVLVNPQVSPPDLSYILPLYPSSYNITGLTAETRYCHYIVVSEACYGVWSGQYWYFTLTSNTVCVTTLPASTPPDTTAPFVVSTSPADGSSGVSWRPIIYVHFSEIVDPQTVTHHSFTVSDPSGPIAGGGYLGVNGTVAAFMPSEPLSSETTYTAAVTADVTDLAGSALVPYSWTFTTQ